MPLLTNRTPFPAEVVPMIDQDGHNLAVVIVKGTYRIEGRGGLAVAEEQEKIAFVEEFVGGAGQGDPRVPSDLVDHKPATDLVLVRPATDLAESPLYGRRVTVAVGPVSASGRVAGRWAFGPVRRDDRSRRRFAGTCDQAWVDDRMPLLPVDFDPRYHQVAPAGQVAPGHLAGDERVSIAHLYADGQVIDCELPGRAVVVAGNVLGRYFAEPAALDTVLVWSERPQVTLTWRHAIRPRQKVEEVRNVFLYLVRLRTARELYGKP